MIDKRYPVTVARIYYPRWIVGNRAVGPQEWTGYWDFMKVRAEVRQTAAQLASMAFDADGAQIIPVSYSYLARATGRSESSAKRFFAKARTLGMLKKIGEVKPVQDRRGIPLYVLTVPELVQVSAATLEACVGVPWTDGDYVPQIWNSHGEPPEWAVGPVAWASEAA